MEGLLRVDLDECRRGQIPIRGIPIFEGQAEASSGLASDRSAFAEMSPEEESPRTPPPVVRATAGNPRGLLSAYQGAKQKGVVGSPAATKGFRLWPQLSDYLCEISCRLHRRGGLFEACESTPYGLEPPLCGEGPGLQHEPFGLGRPAKSLRRHPHTPAQPCPWLERRGSVSLDRSKGQAAIARGQTVPSDQAETGKNPAPIHRSSNEDAPETSRAWFRAIA